MAGLTVTRLADLSPSPQKIGQMKAEFCVIAFDSSYPTGGEPVTPAIFGMSKVVAVQPIGPAMAIAGAGTSAYTVGYDAVNKKLQAFGGAASGVAGAEVANTTDLSASAVTAIVYGLG